MDLQQRAAELDSKKKQLELEGCTFKPKTKVGLHLRPRDFIWVHMQASDATAGLTKKEVMEHLNKRIAELSKPNGVLCCDIFCLLDRCRLSVYCACRIQTRSESRSRNAGERSPKCQDTAVHPLHKDRAPLPPDGHVPRLRGPGLRHHNDDHTAPIRPGKSVRSPPLAAR